MRGAGVILRRELGAYFNAPMAYVVAIAFTLLNNGLYVLDLWMADTVSMRGWFEWVSWSACLVIPAITMRSWAEERRGSTYELLLTFPMRTIALVAGKFLAAVVFYLFCLAGSLVIPVALKLLSVEGLAPDWGAMAAGYVGTILVGALLIALGLFLSALCRDQIEAYIVTLVACVALRLVGFAPIAGQIDSLVPGFGTFLRESVSFSTPLSRFTRGLVALGDVLWVLAWTSAFLLLNGVVVDESRLKPGSRVRKAAALALGIPIVVLLGSFLLEIGARADLTAEKLYTVSPAAGEVLREIPEGNPVRVKLYVSPKDEMPAFMATLERDVVEKLEAFQRQAEGRLVVDVVHLHADDALLRAVQEDRAALLGEDAAAEAADDGDDAKGEVEEKLSQEGVLPFRVRTGGLTGSETKVVYAALALTHGASRKEILPQILPQSLGSLEQDLVSRVYRLVHDRRPVVGLMAPIQAVDIPPQQMQLMAQLGIPLDQLAREQDDYRVAAALLAQNDQYQVRRLRPGDPRPVPADLDTLVVLRPEGLSDRERWEIARFLARGKSVVLAVQSFDSGLRQTRQGPAVHLAPVETGVDPLLAPWGLSVPGEMVLAAESFPLTYSTGPFGGAVTVDFRWIFTLDAGNLDHGTSLANGVGGLMLVDGASPVRRDEARLAELGLEWTPVVSTDADAWTREVPAMAIPPDLNDPMPGTGPIPLAVLVRGTFPAPDATPPPWPDADPSVPEPPAEAITPAPGKLFLLGMARPFHDQAIAEGGGVGWSGVLLKNAVDALSLGDALMRLTAREPVQRPIRDVERSEIVAYELAILGLAPLVILVIGVARLVARRRRQDRVHRPAAAAGAAS